MVVDSFAATQPQRDQYGQCTIVSGVPEGKACRCNPPDGYDATGGCDFGNPFDPNKDYLPGLLGGAKRTAVAPNHPAIHRDLLACEINTRKRPVVTSWRDRAYRCENAGHTVVVSDFVEQAPPNEALVLIRDPMPVKRGNVYWLTWLGYTCGYKLGGHCADYYDVPGPPQVPPECPAMAEADPDYCEKSRAKFAPIPLEETSGAVRSLLSGDLGARLRGGLGLPASVIELDCDEALLVHSARIQFEGATVGLSRLGSSRLVCRSEGETWRSPFSILLIGDEQEGWRLAGFGAENTSLLMQQSADPLVSALLAENLGVSRPLELYELEIPGTGDLLLIDPTSPEKSTVNLRLPELGVRSLSTTLGDPVAGLGSPSLEVWIRSLTPED